MKRFLILTAALLAFSGLCAQNFKGSIHFRYSTQKDTTVNVYHVKEHMVKLDQYSRRNDNTVEGSFLFDLNAGEIKFLNPKRKLWGRQNSETPAVISGTCVVTKGRNVKSIAGLRCKEYIVRNVEENTIITYWITEENFHFFMPLIKLWNRKDKQSVYFSQIKELKPGSMPMMSEERQLDTGRILTKLEVFKISRSVPPEDTFMVPKDYSKFDG